MKRVILKIIPDDANFDIVDQSWTIMDIVKKCPLGDWAPVFQDAMPELQDISNILEAQEKAHGRFYPDKKDIFRAFALTPLSKVRVVLLGQDPYHQTLNNGEPRAVGLSFSVRPYDSIPSSLQNIYKELGADIPGFSAPRHGDLTKWAQQGIFLINSCLTVRPGEAGSHGQIWHGFLKKVFKGIASARTTKKVQPIYLLLGREAQKATGMIDENTTFIETSHPSGFSANHGFLGSRIFSRTNEFLIKMGDTPVNWQI